MTPHYNFDILTDGNLKDLVKRFLVGDLKGVNGQHRKNWCRRYSYNYDVLQSAINLVVFYTMRGLR